VTQNTYRDSLKEARSSFKAAKKRKGEITFELNRLNEELSRLRRTITALAAMCSESTSFDKLGITDMCLEVMESTPFSMTTQEVVDLLEDSGYDINSQKNANASVHAVLTRLAKNEKLTKVGDGDKVKWRGPSYDKKIDDGLYEVTDEDIPF
jgi:predicted nuclease with TOPRIM domain